jgi:predicted O-methyltransferase YrrM
MFHDMRTSIFQRMKELEEIDAADRRDGTPRMQRLRQIPPDTGKFIALLAATAPAGTYLEVGTSAGYSSLWLALACEKLGRHLITFEVLPEKARLARETFARAGVENSVQLIESDARRRLHAYDDIAFCFLDAEKEVYAECYELIIPRMVSGGILVADNAINHRETLEPMLRSALNDRKVDALIVPIGNGELVCRKL